MTTVHKVHVNPAQRRAKTAALFVCVAIISLSISVIAIPFEFAGTVPVDVSTATFFLSLIFWVAGLSMMGKSSK